jgi:hypothetical protein
MIVSRGTLNQTPGKAPGVKAFAILSGIDNASQAILISVFPVVMYRIYSDAQLVSEAYFVIGLLSFLVTLIPPGSVAKSRAAGYIQLALPPISYLH